jgi:hypothetical protein
MTASRASRPAFNALLTAAILCAIVIPAVLWLCDGWHYYRTPVATRGYMEAHPILRPSGYIGLPLGVAGAVAMVSTLPYAVRKRWRVLSRLGAMPRWLEVHIFFGIVGPVLVTLHTAFKFNGVIAVGYWLMVTVWASGFVGRYLYVRIPKTIRGAELSRQEIESALAHARRALDGMALPDTARVTLETFDRAVTPGDGTPPGVLDLFFGELRVRIRLLLMRRRLRAAGVDVQVVNTAVARAAEHATLVRRIAHLQRTRRLFGLWHLFHRPLVYAMFAIVSLHIAIAVYLGYASLALVAMGAS